MRALNVILILLSVMLVVSFQNCAPRTQFAQVVAGNLNAASTSNGLVEEDFKVLATDTTVSKPLDMIWIVDNSGSMDYEAGLVRINLQAFLSELGSTLDIHFLLISEAGSTETMVSLPSGLSSNLFKSINVIVDSTNGPKVMLNSLPSFISANPGFFRSNSKKAIVFVTDDNSAMTGNTFLSNLQSQFSWNVSDISVFGFIGQGSVSPCQARTGLVYDSLAQTTGGVTYNICNTDWSADFSSLTKTIFSKANVSHQFTLKNPKVSSIVTATVAGVIIDPRNYSLAGNVLSISAAVTLLAGNDIVIKYAVTP